MGTINPTPLTYVNPPLPVVASPDVLQYLTAQQLQMNQFVAQCNTILSKCCPSSTIGVPKPVFSGGCPTYAKNGGNPACSGVHILINDNISGVYPMLFNANDNMSIGPFVDPEGNGTKPYTFQLAPPDPNDSNIDQSGNPSNTLPSTMVLNANGSINILYGIQPGPWKFALLVTDIHGCMAERMIVIDIWQTKNTWAAVYDGSTWNLTLVSAEATQNDCVASGWVVDPTNPCRYTCVTCDNSLQACPACVGNGCPATAGQAPVQPNAPTFIPAWLCTPVPTTCGTYPPFLTSYTVNFHYVSNARGDSANRDYSIVVNATSGFCSWAGVYWDVDLKQQWYVSLWLVAGLSWNIELYPPDMRCQPSTSRPHGATPVGAYYPDDTCCSPNTTDCATISNVSVA